MFFLFQSLLKWPPKKETLYIYIYLSKACTCFSLSLKCIHTGTGCGDRKHDSTPPPPLYPLLFDCYTAGATWNYSHLSMFCVYQTAMHHVTSLHANPHNYVGCMCVSCNLPPALMAEWPRSFVCYCSNMGVDWIPEWESTQKVDPGEKNSARTWTRDLSIMSLVL